VSSIDLHVEVEHELDDGVWDDLLDDAVQAFQRALLRNRDVLSVVVSSDGPSHLEDAAEV
jgi:hypothetical protein